MKNNNELLKKLTRDINRLQNKIEHRRLYNIYNAIIRMLLKSGIAIDYIFPFILAAIVVANSKGVKSDPPFHIDEVTEKASIETIDTSSGIHIEHLSYDFSYDNNLLEHSTGWIMNDKGLYERTVTSYRLDDEVNLEDTEKIFEMTKEEIEKTLVITNIETIKKNKLTKEDEIYNSDAIIIIKHAESETETITRPETTEENFWNSIIYIVTILFYGIVAKKIEKIFVKTYIRDSLRECSFFFRSIDKEELETMRKILKLKQENLAMINSNESTSYSRKLRKS